MSIELRLREVWVKGWAIRGDYAVALIPKAGSQSIQLDLGYDCYEPESAMECSHRIAFIRDPINRCRSAYGYFHFLAQHNHVRDVPVKYLGSFDAFAEYAVEYPNDHWRPQAELVGDVPNLIHRFEEIDELWYRYFKRLLPHENQMVEIGNVKAKPGLLEDYYKADFELRERCG